MYLGTHRALGKWWNWTKVRNPRTRGNTNVMDS